MHVILAALSLTLANVPKPLVIDDPTYVSLARQIATDPGDPYGIDIEWSNGVEPAYRVVGANPVLPYWIAGSMALFGDEPWRWKLALFPFALALAASLHRLLARFAAGLEVPLLWMAVLSPPILPFVNLMLDVPAVALALLALVLFLASCDRDRIAGVVGAGVVAGIAMQTKYTAATSLAAMLVWGALFGRWRKAVLACATGVAVFAGWEGWMALRYAESPFVHGVLFLQRGPAGFSPGVALLWTLGFLLLIGALAPAVGVLGLAALGASRRVVAAATLACGLGFAAIPFLPAFETPQGDPWPRLAGAAPEQLLFLILGLGTAASVLAVVRTRLAARAEPADVFLVCWLALEIAGFAALSPFLAARRVVGVSLVALLLCGRAASRSPRPVAVGLPVAAGVALALVFAASDLADALAVRDSVAVAERELQQLGAEPGRESVWFAGGWGFAFHAQRAGMRPVVSGRSQLRRGDWLVTAQGISFLPLRLPGAPIPIARADVRSASPWSTHPGAYLGPLALRPRAQAIIRLWFYRVQADFVPELDTRGAARPPRPDLDRYAGRVGRAALP